MPAEVATFNNPTTAEFAIPKEFTRNFEVTEEERIKEFESSTEAMYDVAEKEFGIRQRIQNRVQSIAHSIFRKHEKGEITSASDEKEIYEKDKEINHLKNEDVQMQDTLYRSRAKQMVDGLAISEDKRVESESQVITKRAKKVVENMVGQHMNWVALHLEKFDDPQEQTKAMNAHVVSINNQRELLYTVYGMGDGMYQQERAKAEKYMLQELLKAYFSAGHPSERQKLKDVIGRTLGYPVHELTKLTQDTKTGIDEKIAYAMKQNTQDKTLEYIEGNPQMLRSRNLPNYES